MRLSQKLLALILSTVTFPSASYAQESCSSVLTRNIEQRSSDQVAEYSYYRLIDTKEEFDQAKSLSGSGQYKLIEISANYDEYSRRRSEYFSQSSIQMSNEHSERYFSSTVSDGNVSAWRDCMSRRGRTLVVYAKNITQDAVTLVLSYDPPADVPPLRLTRAEAKGLREEARGRNDQTTDLSNRLRQEWDGKLEDSLILDRNPEEELRLVVSIGGSTDDLLVPAVPPEPITPNIVLRTFISTSVRTSHPTARTCVPEGYKLVGGGAKVDYEGSGSLLTESYPEGRCWIASAKDHLSPDPAIITSYAIGLQDTSNDWNVEVFSDTGPRAQHPSAVVSIPNRFAMTSCGGRINWRGSGNLLTAIIPRTLNSCEVRGKDHVREDPATATVYAIGIAPNNGSNPPETEIFSIEGPAAAHPEAVAAATGAYSVTGGGARANYTGTGSLLTSSYPSGNGWFGSSKDHMRSDPSSITVFGISVK